MRGKRRGPVPIPVAERFWKYVVPEPNSGCWLWDGGYNSKGYGRLYVGSVVDSTARQALAHKLAFEMYRGEVPEGLELDHLCRVTACVNPLHLEPVTHAENIRRSRLGKVETNPAAKVNKEKTHCKRGHLLSGENVYRHDGKRHCRLCMQIRSAIRAPAVAARLKARKAADPKFALRRRQYQTEWARKAREAKQGLHP